MLSFSNAICKTAGTASFSLFSCEINTIGSLGKKRGKLLNCRSSENNHNFVSLTKHYSIGFISFGGCNQADESKS